MPRLIKASSIRIGVTIAGAVLTLVSIAPLSAAAATTEAKTPDQLVANLIAAAHSGDVDGYLSLLTAGAREAMTQSVANQASLERAHQAFMEALNSRFGEGATVLSDPPDDLKTALGRLLEAQVLSQKATEKGAIELRVKTTLKTPSGKTSEREQTLLARKEGATWKLALGFPPDAASANQEIAAAERITQEVRDGKYPDRQAAMIALANSWAPKESK
jgi:hypothetical protein